MRYKKYNILELKQFKAQWSLVKTELWSQEKKDIYYRRKWAVDLYIDDVPSEKIFEETGIRHNKVADMIERCIKINPETGTQYGYTALIPNRKISNNAKKQVRDTTSKSKGAFKSLLLQYPGLEIFIRDNYFRNSNRTLEKRMTPSNLHKKFLEECRKQEIQDYEYPFNTSDNAQRTFYSYLKQLEKDYANCSITRENENSIQKFHSTGIGKSVRPTPLVPFSVVQMDGHKIDMLYTVEVQNKHGELVRMPAIRMWLIAVIDVATRAILGYSLTTNENYSQIDVLRAIRNSIIPKQQINFTLPGLKYPDNGGFPSLAIPDTEWAMPDIIMLDNAKSHLAENVINKLCSQLCCSLNFGSVATPETRGIIERLFKTLEDNGYHRLVSTTGSNINDARRVNAEKDSVKYQITYNDIVQLTEYFIVLYNNSPHSALDNQTPLECMQRRIEEAGMLPCIADANMKQKIYDLTNITEIKTIRGNQKQGRRPYITYKGVEYRNDILSQSMGLIGQKLIIEVNPDDISTLKGYFEDGTFLGLLTAVGEWGRRSHSLKTREEAMRLSNYNKGKHNPFYAPLSELENELNERAAKERRARTKAARIRNEQEKDIKNPDKKSNNTVPTNSANSYSKNYALSEENAIKKKKEGFSPEELKAILEAGSVEDAYEKGLL